MTVADVLRHGLRHPRAEADRRGSEGCLLRTRDNVAVQTAALSCVCTCSRCRSDSPRHSFWDMQGCVNSPTHVSLLVLAEQLLRFEQVGEGTAAGHCTPDDHVGTCEVVQYPRGLIGVCRTDSYIQHATCMCKRVRTPRRTWSKQEPASLQMNPARGASHPLLKQGNS